MKNREDRRNAMEELKKCTTRGLLLGVLAIIIFLGLVIISTKDRGNASLKIGLAGVLLILMSGRGVYLTIKGMANNESMYYTVPVCSLFINGVMLLMMIALYIIGIFL